LLGELTSPGASPLRLVCRHCDLARHGSAEPPTKATMQAPMLGVASQVTFAKDQAQRRSPRARQPGLWMGESAALPHATMSHAASPHGASPRAA